MVGSDLGLDFCHSNRLNEDIKLTLWLECEARSAVGWLVVGVAVKVTPFVSVRSIPLSENASRAWALGGREGGGGSQQRPASSSATV